MYVLYVGRNLKVNFHIFSLTYNTFITNKDIIFRVYLKVDFQDRHRK